MRRIIDRIAKNIDGGIVDPDGSRSRLNFLGDVHRNTSTSERSLALESKRPRRNGAPCLTGTYRTKSQQTKTCLAVNDLAKSELRRAQRRRPKPPALRSSALTQPRPNLLHPAVTRRTAPHPAPPQPAVPCRGRPDLDLHHQSGCQRVKLPQQASC